jgi:hypothetical protein
MRAQYPTRNYGEPITLATAAIISSIVGVAGGGLSLGLQGRQKKKEAERQAQLLEAQQQHDRLLLAAQAKQTHDQMQAMTAMQVRDEQARARTARALILTGAVGAVVVSAGIGAYLITRK